ASFQHHGTSGTLPHDSLSVDSTGNVYGVAHGPLGQGDNTSVLWKLSGLNINFIQFVTQPRSAAVGQPIGTVSLAARGGSVVTLALVSAPGAHLSPLVPTAPVINGVATFTSLSVNVPGNYALVAFCNNGQTAVSKLFTVIGTGQAKVDQVKE